MHFLFALSRVYLVTTFAFLLSIALETSAQVDTGLMSYKVETTASAAHRFHVSLQTGGWNKDTINFKMPKWTPGYYQLLNYANAVENVIAKDNRNQNLTVKKK